MNKSLLCLCCLSVHGFHMETFQAQKKAAGKARGCIYVLCHRDVTACHSWESHQVPAHQVLVSVAKSRAAPKPHPFALTIHTRSLTASWRPAHQWGMPEHRPRGNPIKQEKISEGADSPLDFLSI